VGNHTLTFIADDAAAPGSIDSETLVISVLAATGLSAFEQQSARGIAAMEAENYENQTPRSGYAWQLDPSPASGFSGRGAMQVLPDDSVNITSGYAGTSPRLDYPVRFQFTGTHYVWVRGNGPSNAANSVHAGINGQETPSSSGIALPSGDRYGWSNGSHTVQIPSPGVHTVNLWMRESGTIVDKIVLTTDPTFVPTGVGPVESPRGSFNLLPIVENFDDGSAQGWVTVNDTSLSSDWRVVSEGGGNQAYFQFNELGSRTTLDGSYHLGTHSYLSTASALTDFRLRVDLTPLSDAGHDVGVLFRYQSNQAYYRLSFNAAYGFTRLEKRVNGNFTTLARDSRGFRPEQPMEIVVEARGPLIQVFRDGDPIMAVRDGSLGSGSVGLYARGAASFDNLSVVANDTSPRVVISAPLAYSLYPGGPRNLNASAIALSAPAGANVAFELDGQPCNASSQPQSGRFVATCTNAQPGEHVLEAILRTAQFAELDRDTNAAVGVGLEAVGSNHYLALGDSITNGIGDNYAADNISADGRSIGIQGWASVLGERLTDTAGYPNLVSVEATPGDRSDQLLIERLPSILERNPLPNKALILIGTNDSNNSIALPSGAGCNYDQPGGCDNTFKGYLLDIISDLPNAVEAIVSLLPPAFGEGANTGPILNPLNNVQRTQRIRSYNQVIEQEVVTRSGVRLGADLFSCFLRAADGQGPAINHFSLFEDNLHLNGLGQRVMAELLHDALNGAAVQPGNGCPPPLYILQNLSPYTYKQNLLEEGDTYYTDQSYTLTDIPASLTDAIWVMSANADRTSSASSVLSVNLGSAPVTVYVAYDANATVPGWLSTQGFTATSLEVQAAGGSVNRYRLYRSNGRSGLLTLPGNRANGGNGAANYFLAVDP
jgi:lysophospholipase L1-like esterase